MRGQARGQNFLAFCIVLALGIDPERVTFPVEPPTVPKLGRTGGAVFAVLHVCWCKESMVELLQPIVEINFRIAFLVPIVRIRSWGGLVDHREY